jgi:short-subunit dehydrogenase
VWVSGASSGIGEELVNQLDKSTHHIVLSGRNIPKLNEIASRLQSEYTIISFDMAIEAEVDKALNENKQILEKVDVVFLNAGISQRSLARDTDMKTVRKLLEINFFSHIKISSFLLPSMIKNKGHFVVMSSLTGVFGVPYRSSYSASKHALHGYFESLRLEEYVLNITIACPGFIKTDISKNALQGNGIKYGKLDPGQATGMPVDKMVNILLKAVVKKKHTVYIGAWKETKLGVFLHNNFPRLFYKIIKRSKVK